MLIEKSAPIRDSSFEEARYDMKDCYPNVNSGEESILEYGPGIVRKLRSKYQSLALRQSFLRPSLRRSTSLENGLELDVSSTATSTPEPRIQSPSPVPSTEPDNRAFRGTMTLNIQSPTSGGGIQRGRAVDANRQNRMRRARSVDALHHGELTRREEEILEKFKTVVLPREEVVIIEMTKPRVNLGNLNCNTSTNDEYGSSNQYLRSNSAGSNSGTETRARSITSPEHELPPHDIVRETARIFENNSGSHWRRIGHALRLSKSSTASPSDSISNSPVPPLPTHIPSADKHCHAALAKELLLSNNNIPLQREESQFKIVNSKMANNFHNTNLSNSYTSPTSTKKVGVIRPTVNGVTKPVVSLSLKGAPGSRPAPSSSEASTNKAFQFVNPKKPPLGPKPVLSTPVLSQTTANGNSVEDKTSNNSKFTTPTFSNQSASAGREKSPELTLQVESKLSRSRSPSPMFPPRDTIRPYSPLASSETKNCIAKAIPSTLSSNSTSVPSSNKENESSMTQTTQFPVALKPVIRESESMQQQGRDGVSKSNSTGPVPHKTVPSRATKFEGVKLPANSNANGITTPNSVLKEGDVLKNKKSQIEADKISEKAEQPVSQLRSHQRQKSSQQTNGGAGTMVFNFTNRNKVPDYIEDDGLHRISLSGAVGDASSDDVDGSHWEAIDPKLINFVGANVIINGKSSLQKKPKSQKVSFQSYLCFY